MITLFFFVIFVLRLVYLDFFKSSGKPKSSRISFVVPIGLIAIILAPILYVNFSHKPGRPLSNAEILAEALDNPYDTDLKEAFALVMLKEPTNIPLRFSFIEETSRRSLVDEGEEGLKTYLFSEDSVTQRQSLAYVYARYFTEDTSLVQPLKNGPYTNFIEGTRFAHLGETEKAYHAYRKSILTEEPSNMMQREFFLFTLFNAELLENRLNNDKPVIHKLNLSVQRFIYYRSGQLIPYLGTIAKATFQKPSFIAFFAALIISICWLVFIRSLDIFRQERWLDIIIVFLLGGFFTHFCWIGYDYAEFSWGFGISGSFLNDFLYCVGVIGVGEELVKLIPWIAFIFLARKAKEPYDYILYASVSALGFAFVENFKYLEEPGNISARAIMSTVMHMFAASMVAYGFILGRYRAKSREWKILYPVFGFIAASFAHGFYDFWIISPAAKSFSYITVLFFVATTAVWFKMINNAMNNSPYYVARNFNPVYQLHIISIGLVVVMALEYLILYAEYGTNTANSLLAAGGWMVPVFLNFVSLLLLEFEVAKGRWRKFEDLIFGWLPSISRASVATDESLDNSEFEGLEVRLFVPKSNRYVGSKFPIRARCVGLVTVSGSNNWCLFQITSSFHYPGFRNDYVIIRTKEPYARLDQDKVEILMLFVPSAIRLNGEPIQTTELRFTGKAFSRPV